MSLLAELWDTKAFDGCSDLEVAIRRGGMTKEELAEAVQLMDMLPKGLQAKVREAAGHG